MSDWKLQGQEIWGLIGATLILTGVVLLILWIPDCWLS